MELTEQEIRKIVQDEIKIQSQSSFSKSKLLPNVKGSRGSNAALTSLLSALAANGIIVDNSTV